MTKTLWLKMHSTGADVAETEKKTFQAVAAVSGLPFQPSAATTDPDYWLLVTTPYALPVPCTSAGRIILQHQLKLLQLQKCGDNCRM